MGWSASFLSTATLIAAAVYLDPLCPIDLFELINHFFFLNNNVPLSLHSYRTAERWLIWNMINLFLLTGYIPQAFEVVTIKPLLKKALPDPAV